MSPISAPPRKSGVVRMVMAFVAAFALLSLPVTTAQAGGKVNPSADAEAILWGCEELLVNVTNVKPAGATVSLTANGVEVPINTPFHVPGDVEQELILTVGGVSEHIATLIAPRCVDPGPRPDDIVEYGEWQGGAPSCDEPTVEQTRQVTTTRHDLSDDGSAWVPGDQFVTSETREVSLTSEELAQCPTGPVPDPDDTPKPTPTPEPTPEPTETQTPDPEPEVPNRDDVSVDMSEGCTVRVANSSDLPLTGVIGLAAGPMEFSIPAGDFDDFDGTNVATVGVTWSLLDSDNQPVLKGADSVATGCGNDPGDGNGDPGTTLAVPVDPLFGIPACSDFELSDAPGVDYVVTSSQDGNILTVTVTATPQEDYHFEGNQVVVYSRDFDISACGTPPDGDDGDGNDTDDTGTTPPSQDGGDKVDKTASPRPGTHTVPGKIEADGGSMLPLAGRIGLALALAGLAALVAVRRHRAYQIG